MKRVWVYLGVVLLLASCAGYFPGPGGEDNGDGINFQSLKLADGSGYVSSDTANEISPFLYRASSGEAYLFFSSDRDGTYDIFFAKMLADGTFEAPVKLGEEINGTNCDDIYPIVTEYGTNTYVTFLCTNSSSIIFAAYTVTNSSFRAMYLSDMEISGTTVGLGIRYDVVQNLTNIALFYSDTPDADFYVFDDISGWNFSSEYYTLPFYANAGSSVVFTNSGLHSDTYLVSSTNSKGKYQIGFLIENIYGLITNKESGFLSLYASDYNDRDPVFDYVGDYNLNCKVYFASDRLGTYDLYRYNSKTLNQALLAQE